MKFQDGPAPRWISDHHERLLGLAAEEAVAIVEQAGFRARVLPAGQTMITADLRIDRINLRLSDAGLVESADAN
jgi:hypothetical protein